MSVEKLWDELCIGVKCQSNVEIAGSPRNSFRDELCIGVKCQSNVEIAGSPRNSFRASLRRHIKTVEH